MAQPAAIVDPLSSHDGTYSSRALFPFDSQRRVELYELRLKPSAVERAEPHAPGTQENLVVDAGAVEIEVGERARLARGDAILFHADVPTCTATSAPARPSCSSS